MTLIRFSFLSIFSYARNPAPGRGKSVTRGGPETIPGKSTMRNLRPVLGLAALLLGAQDGSSLDAGLHELGDVGVAGWHRRLGADYAAANPSGADRKKPPLLYQPPPKPCPPARHAKGMTYEVGGPPAKEAGDYSSTQAQVLYATD